MAAALPPQPSSTRYRVLVVLGLIVAAGAMALAVIRTDTEEDPPVAVQGRPDIVEHLIPARDAQVPRQAEFGIDLTAGWDGTLVVNGTEIPRSELRLVPEQSQIFFTAGEDKTIEELPAGRNCVDAVVWKRSVGPGTAEDRRFEWCFNVL